MSTNSTNQASLSESIAYGRFRFVFRPPCCFATPDITKDYELADYDTQIMRSLDKTISLVDIERLLINLISAASVDIGVDGGDTSVLSFDLSRHAQNVADITVNRLTDNREFHQLQVSVDRTAHRMFGAFAGSSVLNPLDLLIPIACGERGYTIARSAAPHGQSFIIEPASTLYYDVNGVAGGLYSMHYPLFADFFARRNKEILAGITSTRNLDFDAYIVTCLAGPITQALIFFACCKGAARLYQRRTRGSYAWQAQSFNRDLNEPRPDLNYAAYLTIGNKGLRRSATGLSFLNDVTKDLFIRIYLDSANDDDASQSAHLLRMMARTSGRFTSDELNAATGMALAQYTPYADVAIIGPQTGTTDGYHGSDNEPMSGGSLGRTETRCTSRDGQITDGRFERGSTVAWDATQPADADSSVSIAWALGL